jgi:hypothetical protein
MSPWRPSEFWAVRAFFHRAVVSSWHDELTDTQGNKLRVVKPSEQGWNSFFSYNRKEEVTLSGPRTCRSRLTQKHLLLEEPASICTGSCEFFSLLDILIEWQRCNEDRVTFHLQGTLRDMLGEDRRGVSNVLAFLNGLWLAKAI